MVFVLWINLEQPWASIGTPTGFDPRNPNGEVDYALAALRIAGAALVVPIMEELFWRSFIMRWVEQTAFFYATPLCDHLARSGGLVGLVWHRAQPLAGRHSGRAGLWWAVHSIRQASERHRCSCRD